MSSGGNQLFSGVLQWSSSWAKNSSSDCASVVEWQRPWECGQSFKEPSAWDPAQRGSTAPMSPRQALNSKAETCPIYHIINMYLGQVGGEIIMKECIRRAGSLCELAFKICVWALIKALYVQSPNLWRSLGPKNVKLTPFCSLWAFLCLGGSRGSRPRVLQDGRSRCAGAASARSCRIVRAALPCLYKQLRCWLMRSRLPLRAGLDRGREVIKGLAAVQGTSGTWELLLGQREEGGGRELGQGRERLAQEGAGAGRRMRQELALEQGGGRWAGDGAGRGRKALGRRQEEGGGCQAGARAGGRRRTPDRRQEPGQAFSSARVFSWLTFKSGRKAATGANCSWVLKWKCFVTVERI